MKIKLIFLFFISLVLQQCAVYRAIDYSDITIDHNISITRIHFDSIIGLLKEFHPNPFGNISETHIDSLIDDVVTQNKGKLLSVADWTFELRKVLDSFTYNDPHFTITPVLYFNQDKDVNYNHIKVLPFEILQINDTVLIGKSYNKILKEGDRLLKINGINISEFLHYMYPSYRSSPGYLIQAQNNFIFSSQYILEVQRATDILNVIVEGVPLGKYGMGEPFIKEKIYSEYQTGYFKINQFENNRYIIKKLSKHIDKVKKFGFKNIIIDVRNNPGGSGYAFDQLFSLFSDKDSLHYMNNQSLKVSSASINDYDFLKDSVGQLVKIPDSLVFNKINLNRTDYKGALNYYVMIDKSTASVASSFANIMQYNNLALLVGEPLNYNATKYGDIIEKSVFEKLNISISTMEYNEYTKSVDGVVHPDILIPYEASKFMRGGDPILDKLLEYITKVEF